MRRDLTIGEMARLLGVPADTLRYYDSIGLLKPIRIDDHNKYRYYGHKQYLEFNAINYYRSLDISLPEIKGYLEHKDVVHRVNILKKKNRQVNQELRRLIKIRQEIHRRMKKLDEVRDLNGLVIVTVKKLPERRVSYFEARISSSLEAVNTIKKIKDTFYSDSVIFFEDVCFLVSQKDLLKGTSHDYCGLFLPRYEFEAESDRSRTIAAGEYACICFWGNKWSAQPYFQRMLDYIDQQGYQVAGDAITRILFDSYTYDDKDSSLRELQIPITR